MHSFGSAAIAQTFEAYPPAVRQKLLAVREIIFETAAATPGVGPLEETLKWGEPAYVTSRSGGRSAVRIGWRKHHPSQYAVYFNCQTTLVDTFRTLFPTEFRFEGNRAIVFDESDSVPADSLSFCIGAALTYHSNQAQARARKAAT